MPINIQSLFADIISTPEQREDKLLKEGMLQGQLLASGLKGRAAALSPLAQIAGQYGVQRQENLKRAVQPMLGIDPRSSEERLQESLAGMDLNSPTGLRDAALAIQSVDPLRAATLRQAALEMQRETTDRERIAEDRLRTQKRQDEADQRARDVEERAIASAERSEQSFENNQRAFQNSLTTFQQQQEDRETNLADLESNKNTANILKGSLLENMLQDDPDNPYIKVLENQDSYIPLDQLRIIENQFKNNIKQDIGVYTVFDKTTGKNMIISFDKKTGDQINVIGEAGRTSTNRDRDVPNLTDGRKEILEDALDAEKIFDRYKIYTMTTGNKETGKNALVDMLHNYSERNNESYAQSIAVLRKEFENIDNASVDEQKELLSDLKLILSSGLLPSEISTNKTMTFDKDGNLL